MPLREDLLVPIAGENPSGADVRYDTELLLYDKIKEARRQDDDLAQGDWQRERKLADYPQVIKLAQEALATKTKDLQLAVWLAEALLHTDRYAGLRQGLVVCHGLISNFWDTLYPPIEDGDLELRAGPLDWLGTSLEVPLKSVPLVSAGDDWFKYKDSRLVGYEEQAQNDKDKKARAKKIAEGKLAPEAFDKAFAEKLFENCRFTGGNGSSGSAVGVTSWQSFSGWVASRRCRSFCFSLS
jgi:type VI secretion system protein ImpA